MRTTFKISLCALAIGALACRERTAQRDTIPSAKVVTQSGDVLLARREAQVHFDSARALFVAKDFTMASRNLQAAALFVRGHSDSIAEPAKRTLKASAEELDQLSSRLASGSVASARTLDNAFARAQLAETQYHCVRALDAWKVKDRPTTGGEMLMLIDHFERAAVDSRQVLGPSAKKMVTDARTIATKLVRGETVDAAVVDSSLAAVDKHVHQLATRASEPKR